MSGRYRNHVMPGYTANIDPVHKISHCARDQENSTQLSRPLQKGGRAQANDTCQRSFGKMIASSIWHARQGSLSVCKWHLAQQASYHRSNVRKKGCEADTKRQNMTLMHFWEKRWLAFLITFLKLYDYTVNHDLCLSIHHQRKPWQNKRISPHLLWTFCICQTKNPAAKTPQKIMNLLPQ